MGGLPSSRRLKFNALIHSLSIISTLISFIMLSMVAFYNAPLDHVHSTLESTVGARMWLITVNETSNTLIYDKSHSDYPNKRFTHYNPADFESSENDNVNPMREGLGLGRRDDSGIHAYGFGIWGWCEWSNNDWMGNAKCTKKAFWTLPKCAMPTWDNIDQVMGNFPDAVTKALSSTSFLVVFAPFLVLSFLILLCFALRFPGPYPPYPMPPKSERKWSKDTPINTQTKIAWILRDWKTHVIFFILMSILLIPTIVTVLIAKSKLNNTDKVAIGGALISNVGTGFDLIFASWVCLLIAQGFCMLRNGLIPKGKKVSKLSTG
ncbi:uncharacterized protein IL334_000324 [Kwoniella shivajii]|uniref:Uncharacterized protein n=1 Tax=Kwoniella shivajii TaxID=564305 RepID=A0ABZ1CPW7_9TREE|nr:hypothetical protein IL334_000324 [Kwoniella shivajii]